MMETFRNNGIKLYLGYETKKVNFASDQFQLELLEKETNQRIDDNECDSNDDIKYNMYND